MKRKVLEQKITGDNPTEKKKKKEEWRIIESAGKGGLK